MHKMRIKKGDTVQMITGKDRGKQGRVVDARPVDRKVVVENLNQVKRHQRPRPIRDGPGWAARRCCPAGSSSARRRSTCRT
jgi:ribosomal protein L24